jgi:tyrosinase
MAANTDNFVRRDVWSLRPDDPIITYYAKAVSAMQSRPAGDPTSWAYQAAIHGTEAGPNKPLWNQCQHGTWFFLPWHRMFLYHFEEIVRAAVIEGGGPHDWALPYWNYGLGGQKATLPLPFRRPKLDDGKPNPLFVSQRAPGINSGAELPSQATSPARALHRPHYIGAAEFGGGITQAAQFSQRTGKLEGTPHNAVHGVVGGQAGWMGNILAAAKDPIFWLHHANIDRLWVEWSSVEGRTDPAQQQWRGHAFQFFEKNGKKVAMKCAGVLDTEADLHYTYDSTPPVAAARAVAAPDTGSAAMKEEQPQMVGATDRSFELVGEPVDVEVPVDAQAAGELAPDQHVYLNVEDIEGERNPGTVYGVYVDLPPEAPPEAEAAHHVGNLSFFGIEGASSPQGDEHAHGLRIAMDISAIAHELASHGKWAGHSLAVAFRPLALTPPDDPDPNDPVEPPTHHDLPVRIGRVSVFYDA